MNPTIPHLLIGIFWKSSALLGAALCLNILLRKRSADLRRTVLSAAVLALVFSAIVSPTLPHWTAITPAWLSASSQHTISVADAPTSGDLMEAPPAEKSPPASERMTRKTITQRAKQAPGLIPIVWIVGATLLLIRLAFSLYGLRRLRNASNPVSHPDTLAWLTNASGREVSLLKNAAIGAPVTWGTARPVILIPASFELLPPNSRNAALCHELGHIEAHDFMMRIFCEITCALLWFQPLIWIVRRQLREVQELACDNRVLAAGTRPSAYAKLLLDWNSPLPERDALIAVGFTHKSCLTRRLYALLDENLRRDAMSRSGVLVACLVALAAALPLAALTFAPSVIQPFISRENFPLVAPIVAGIVNPTRPPVELAQAGTIQRPIPAPSALSTPAAIGPRFANVTLTHCSARDPNREVSAGSSSDGPSYLNIPCRNLYQIIDMAFFDSGGRLINNSSTPDDPGHYRGGPSWVYDDFYGINATGKGGPGGGAEIRGNMLQAFLEERFQLKTHTEVEEAPMYNLTLSGETLRLQPHDPATCPRPDPLPIFDPIDPALPQREREAQAMDQIKQRVQQRMQSHVGFCGARGIGANGPNRTYDAAAVHIGALTSNLGTLFLHRRVFDKTGLTESYDIQLEFAPDQNTPDGPAVDSASNIPPAPSIFMALEQLGLKLEPTTGPRAVIVIDHVERPPDN